MEWTPCSQLSLKYGLHFLIVVPTNLLRLDAPGWTEECKEYSFWSFCCQRTNKLFQRTRKFISQFFFFTQLFTLCSLMPLPATYRNLVFCISACFCSWQINVRVTTMDAELEFAILPSTTGKQLFDQVQCAQITAASVLKEITDNILHCYV